VVDVVRVPSGVAVLAWGICRRWPTKRPGVTWETSAAELRSTPEILDEYRRLAEGRGSRRAAWRCRHRSPRPRRYWRPNSFLSRARSDGAAQRRHRAEANGAKSGPCQMQMSTPILPPRCSASHRSGQINTLLAAVASVVWVIRLALISELAEIAKAIGGRLPHVVWTREDDIKGVTTARSRCTASRSRLGGPAVGSTRSFASLFVGTPLEEEIAKDGFDRQRPSCRHPMMEGLLGQSYDARRRCRSLRGAPWPTLTRLTPSDDARQLAEPKGSAAFRRNLLARSRDLVVLNWPQKAGWGRPMARCRGRGIAATLFKYSSGDGSRVTTARTSAGQLRRLRPHAIFRRCRR
jgi:hypothetical protein